MTFIITTLSMMPFIIMPLSIMTLSIMDLIVISAYIKFFITTLNVGM